LGTEAKEKAEEGKMVAEDDDLKITSNGKIKIYLIESTKVKELEKISVDMKEVDNVNDQIEVTNADEYTKTTLEDDDRILTEEAISNDNKKEIRADVEGVCNINSKSRVDEFINKVYTSDVVEIEKNSKITTGTTINRSIDVLNPLPDSDETKLGYIKVNTDERDGKLSGI